jgi:hypothetical protein
LFALRAQADRMSALRHRKTLSAVRSFLWRLSYTAVTNVYAGAGPPFNNSLVLLFFA